MEASQTVDRVGVLMEQAVEIESEREALNERRTANREALRNLYRADILTDEEKAWVDEVYPFSERKKRDENMPNYEGMDAAALDAAVSEAGLAVEGTGRNGNVLKADKVAALEAHWTAENAPEDGGNATEDAAATANGNDEDAEDAATEDSATE